MHEFRIAIGLIACTVAWLAIAPASPTLIGLASSAPSAEPAVVLASPRVEATGVAASAPVDLAPASPPVSPPVRATTLAAPAMPAEDAPVRVAAVAAGPQADAEPALRIFNRPVAIDAGTMKAGRTTLRVAEIEPISPDAQCSDGPRSWPCGIRARTAFRSWLRGRSVLCAVPPGETDAADLTVSCLAGESDVGEWLVANGWAAPASSSRYSALGDTAKSERRGIWAYDVAR